MQIPRHFRLHTKFLTGLVLATVFLGSIFSAISYFHVNNVLEEEVRERAKLVFTYVDSIQNYVRDTLRPSMYQRFPSAFVIEAMSSSYISQKVMSPFKNLEDGIIYRRVAIHARNPDYEANEQEQRLIELFRADASLTLWQGYETIAGERYYVMARPVRYGQGCMYCHGKVEDAPAELLDLYGGKGFGKNLGAVAGVDFVGTSVQRSVGRLQQIIFTYFLFFAVGALFFFFTTNVLFRVLVVNNLKRLHDIFRYNIEGMEGDALCGKSGRGDEIEELVGSLERTTDSLARQMNILGTIVEGISDPLALVDADCSVLTVNLAARNLTEELTGGKRTDGNILSLFFDISSESCPMREVLTHGTAEIREVSLPDGRAFSLSMYPVRKRSGESDQVVVYLRETTKEKRIMMQVWHGEKMATVGRLTAGLAHEINNPLGVILCYTRLLRQSRNSPEGEVDLDVIERHTHHAQRVVQDLLNFARPKAAGSGRADVCAVASGLFEVFSVKANKKKVQTRLECSKEQLLVQLGESELEQVLSNLIINAIDAVSEERGRISLRIAERESGMIAIEVEDNGPGVACENEPYIFDPFFSTKDVGVGTGLGLSVVYGIVTDAQGRIEIGRSAALGGACFTVFLPATKKPNPGDMSPG